MQDVKEKTGAKNIPQMLQFCTHTRRLGNQFQAKGPKGF